MPRKHKPIHPGQVLHQDFMEPLGITAYRLGRDIGVTPQQIGRVIRGTRGVSGDLALRLARYLGTSPQVWMGLQMEHDLDVARDRVGQEIEKQITPYASQGTKTRKG